MVLYKEGFSRELIDQLIEDVQPSSVLELRPPSLVWELLPL